MKVYDEDQEAGTYEITWNSKDGSNQKVASGMYFYRLTTSDYSDTKKILLLK